MGCHRARCPTPRVAVNDRYMAECSALLPDLTGVIGGIHEVIAGGYLGAGQLHQRDGHLAIMHGGRGQDGAQGEPTIVDVDMELKTVPGFRVPLVVFLDTTVAGRRQERDGVLRGLLPLYSQT